jgi:hypothetical protein
VSPWWEFMQGSDAPRLQCPTWCTSHVMNSELQHKYLTSIKWLLTYAQKIWPDVDLSKNIM